MKTKPHIQPPFILILILLACMVVSQQQAVARVRFGNLAASPLGVMDCYAQTLNPTSDRQAKQDFKAVETTAILEKILSRDTQE